MKADNQSTTPNLPVKLTIKRRGVEISTEGTLSTIEPLMEELARFLEKAADKFGVSELEEDESANLPSAEEVSATSPSDVPVIKPTKSTMENIVLLFDTPWGRTPHSVAEVMKALEVNAVYDRVEAVSTNLTRLVRKGALRRMSRDGKWAYVRVPGEK